MFAELDKLMGRAEQHGVVGCSLFAYAPQRRAIMRRKDEFIADYRSMRASNVLMRVSVTSSRSRVLVLWPTLHSSVGEHRLESGFNPAGAHLFQIRGLQPWRDLTRA